MHRYIVKRLIQMIPMMFLVSVISFGVTKMAPGDFLSQKMMNPSINPETIQKERERLGLTKPIHIQYLKWIGGWLTGNMGESFAYRVPVSDLLLQRLGNTILLGICTILLEWLVAIPLGTYIAVRQYSTADNVASVCSFVALGTPDFFLAVLLLWGAAATGLFPIGGMTSPNFNELGLISKVLDVAHHLVLPVISLTVANIAILQRRMRGMLLDVLGEDYIRTARAKGLPEHRVIYKHAVRNAINPLITILGFDLAYLISGSALIEIVTGWPGLGQMVYEGIRTLDIYVSLAGLVVSAFMLMLANLLSDILLAMVDPRIKLEA